MAPDGRGDGERQQQDEEEQDLHVDLLLDRSSLDGCGGGVAHELGLVAGEDDEAVDPGRIAQLCAAEQQLLGAERSLAHGRAAEAGRGAELDVERGIKGVEAVVGLLGHHVAAQRGRGAGRGELGGVGRGLLDLEVGLAVQVGGLDVAQAFGLGAREEHEVGGEELVVLDADDVADADVPPSARLKGAGARVEHVGYARVELRVGLVPLDVLLDLLERRGEQHERKRHDGRPTVGGRDAGDLLDARGEEEEDVGVLAELLDEKLGDEGDHVVL